MLDLNHACQSLKNRWNIGGGVCGVYKISVSCLVLELKSGGKNVAACDAS